MNVNKLSEKDIAWADYAFISGMTIQKESARALIKRCNDAGLKVVAGGPLFTMEHEEFEGVDHFVLNEAEITLPLFLADLKEGTASGEVAAAAVHRAVPETGGLGRVQPSGPVVRTRHGHRDGDQSGGPGDRGRRRCHRRLVGHRPR